MAPAWLSTVRSSVFSVVQDPTEATTVSQYLTEQWRNPTDILSVLLLLGPEIIRAAVAQQVGRIITPVSLSFGCAAYAVSALLSTVGEGFLVPNAEVGNTIVVEVETGHQRVNMSWVLGRLYRDLNSAIDKSIKDEIPRPQDSSLEAKPATRVIRNKDIREALRITVYRTIDDPPQNHGVPIVDWVWYSGFVTIVIQVGISIIPWVLSGDWAIFTLTISGNVLILVTGSFKQWREEKWATTKTGGPTVAITSGNGSRTAVVILASKKRVGLNLSILANQTGIVRVSKLVKSLTAVLALLWIVYIITVAGLQQNTWYLLGIGLLGSVQNIMAAGAAREPGAHGIHIECCDSIVASKVSTTLRLAEEKYPGLGVSLLDVYFPGSLRVKGDELEFWKKALQRRSEPNEYGVPLRTLQGALEVKGRPLPAANISQSSEPKPHNQPGGLLDGRHNVRDILEG